MKKRLMIFWFILAFSLFRTAAAQTDTCFWFAAPWVTPDHWWRDPIQFHFNTYNNATTIRIQQPASVYDTTFTVPPFTLFDKVLSHMIDSVESKPANAVLRTGFKITSDFPITAVYEETSRAPNFFNQESYSLKGKNALGLEFITPFQNLWKNKTLGGDLNGDAIVTQPYSQFSICATQSATTIWITPACNIIGHLANVTYSVTLNAGQAYTCQNVTQVENVVGQSLSGSHIVSNKPITVSVSDDTVNPAGGGGCYDLMGDQIVPIDKIGIEYIAVKGQLNAGSNESVFLVAIDSLTSVYADDGVAPQTITLNQYETKSFSLTQATTHFLSNKPVYALHMTGFGCETGEEILPPVVCSGDRTISFSRNNSQTFMLDIVTKNGNQGNFLLDGNNSLITAPSFSVVPGTSGTMVAAQISYTTGQVSANAEHFIQNTNDCFSFGVLNGGATTGGLYHYLSAFAPVNYRLTGTVTYTGGPVSNGIAKLYRDTSNLHMPLVDSVNLVAGTYTFPSVPAGKFIVWIHADTLTYPTLIPTYLDTTYRWDSASVFTINGPCADTIIKNAQMVEAVPMTGAGQITGTITQGINYQRFMSGVNTVGSPIGGVDVGVRKKPTGNIAAMKPTNSSGQYTISNIDPGNYLMYVDIPGLPMADSLPFTITSNENFVNFDWIADSAKIYRNLTTSVSNYKNENRIKIFPNPASGILYISSLPSFHHSGSYPPKLFSEGGIPTRIAVTNLLGEKLFESILPNEKQNKHDSYRVDLSFLQNGIYILSVTDGNYFWKERIIISK